MSVPSSARSVAFLILDRVANGGYASDLIRQHCSPLSERDASLAENIVFGCLRFQSQLDYLVDHFARRSALKLDTPVRVALRMGIFQLRYLDRIPAHAAVSESVELVKRAGKRSAAPLVNAVLRKVNREPVAWPDPATELSVPAWLLERWRAHFGPNAAGEIARAALEQPAPFLNPKTGRQQDIGAQSIVPLLDVQAGMEVLDLCAAPGNKTAQILAEGGKAIACDRYPKRLAEVPSSALRVVLDATAALPFSKTFDRILVDVPCSGTGTLGRNPEIKWRLRAQDLAEFHNRQVQILANALPCLRSGGKLVYATCSLEREENEDVVAEVLAANLSFNLASTHLRLPGRDPGDGFFAAVITHGAPPRPVT